MRDLEISRGRPNFRQSRSLIFVVTQPGYCDSLQAFAYRKLACFSADLSCYHNGFQVRLNISPPIVSTKGVLPCVIG